MPKPTKKRKQKETNPLAEYLITESAREGGGPDRSTDAQIELLMTESGGAAAPAASAEGAAVTNREKLHDALRDRQEEDESRPAPAAEAPKAKTRAKFSKVIKMPKKSRGKKKR